MGNDSVVFDRAAAFYDRTRALAPATMDAVVARLARELAGRLAATHPETRVLYMSGYTDDAIAHHGVLDAGVPFIEKPFSPGALASKVREVLDS